VNVLLLHGQPGSGGDWAGVARELGARGFSVLAPDRPGYGASQQPAGGFDHNARALAGLLDEPAVVAGHSWGAGVALAMAQRFPELVSAIVLVSPVTPGDRLGRVDRALATRRVGPLMARAGFLGAGAVLTRTRLRRRLERAMPGSDPQRWSEVPRAWRSFWVEQRALLDDLSSLAGDVAVPATVVLGTRDRVIDVGSARRYASETGARLVELAGAGHLLPMQRPVEVAGAIAAATSASPGAR
jgi:pimeloyl-ACP methyl ester carboxylesterase